MATQPTSNNTFNGTAYGNITIGTASVGGGGFVGYSQTKRQEPDTVSLFLLKKRLKNTKPLSRLIENALQDAVHSGGEVDISETAELIVETLIARVLEEIADINSPYDSEEAQIMTAPYTTTTSTTVTFPTTTSTSSGWTSVSSSGISTNAMHNPTKKFKPMPKYQPPNATHDPKAKQLPKRKSPTKRAI